MFDTRLNMAATWLWWLRQANRRPGEPSTRPFEQQPDDVAQPVYTEVAEIIRALDTYDSTREVIRVDMHQVGEHAFKLYKSIHPEAQTIPAEELMAFEGAIKIFLHHIRVEGDLPYER